MIGATEHPAGRRDARRILSLALGLLALGALLIAGRALLSSDVATISGPASEPGTVSALPSPSVEGAAPTAPVKPRATADVVTAPASAWPERSGATPEDVIVHRDAGASIDSGDWRDRVAAQLGRKAVEGLPLNAGAMHRHEPGEAGSETRMAAGAVMPTTTPGGASELQGWDGGKFWFGPNGLVRMGETPR